MSATPESLSLKPFSTFVPSAPAVPAPARIHDVVIVGSGPAGTPQVSMRRRAQLDTVLIEGTSRGGALMTTTVVENYPGFREGTGGPLLVGDMCAQAKRFGAQLHPDDVDDFRLDGDVKTVAAAGKVWRSRAVILAMGSAPRRLASPARRGYGAEASVPPPRVRVDVARQGCRRGRRRDAAMEEALFLTGIARSITIVHHRDTFRASPLTTARVRAHDKVTVLTNTSVLAVRGRRWVTGLRLRQHVGGAERDLPVSAVIVAVGHGPARSCSWASSISIPTGMSSREKGPATPRSTAYSPPATWLTAATGRPSPRPPAVAHAPSTPNAG